MPEPEPAPTTEAAPASPRSRRELFTAFTWLALQGFGGVLAVVQRELVEKRQWLTREQFVEDWAVAQIMPGPNVVNLAMMIGGRHFGLSGALVAVAGMLLAPLALLLVMAVLYTQLAHAPAVQGALRGMGAVAAGMIAATGIKLVAALRNNAMGMGACLAFAAASFAGVGLLRWPLAWVLLALGPLACGWAWRRLDARSTA